MNGISQLQSRTHNNDLIERAFVQKILEQEAESMAAAMDRVSLDGLSDKKIDFIRYSRSFQVTGTNLKMEHHIQQRFVDMKRTRYGKQKPVKIHNAILYGHWNNIIFRAKVELTQALRGQIATQLNLEV